MFYIVSFMDFVTQVVLELPYLSLACLRRTNLHRFTLVKNGPSLAFSHVCTSFWQPHFTSASYRRSRGPWSSTLRVTSSYGSSSYLKYTKCAKHVRTMRAMLTMYTEHLEAAWATKVWDHSDWKFWPLYQLRSLCSLVQVHLGNLCITCEPTDLFAWCFCGNMHNSLCQGGLVSRIPLHGE